MRAGIANVLIKLLEDGRNTEEELEERGWTQEELKLLDEAYSALHALQKLGED